MASEQHEDYRIALRWTDTLIRGGEYDHGHESVDTSVRRRLLIIITFVILIVAALAVRLFYMQAVNGAAYTTQAEGNRVRLVVDYAPRGKIFDRDGRILADNTLTFQLSATPYLLAPEDTQRQSDMRRIAGIIDVSFEELTDRLNTSDESSVLPQLLAEDISHEQAIRLLAIIDELAGFELDQVPTRVYDSSAALAHIVGYTGRVNDDDLANNQDNGLLPTDVIGRTGVEASYDEKLRGRNGWRQIEVDAYGRPVRLLAEQRPQAGSDIYLTIDYDVQKSMEEALKKQMQEANSKRSAAVAVDPRNGSVIAMVSLPSYDNNLFTNDWDNAQFERYVFDERQPLYNKVIAGGYTSGSIIKPLVASAALQEGVVNESTIIVDSGALTLPGGFTFLGWRPGGLGPMNVRSALAWSSNIYFYTVGGGFGNIGGLGEERLTKYYRMFGLGEPTGIDMPDEVDGRVPDEEWKRANKGEDWYVGDSYNISIGQGDLLISPLQISMAHAAIANDGTLLSPRVVSDGERHVRRELEVDKRYLQIVREGMRQVLTGGTTCECTFSEVPVNVAGKSGTAETNTPGGRPPHAWYTAFAPYENPEILMTVLLEEGVGGSQFAAPAIARAMETYFNSD